MDRLELHKRVIYYIAENSNIGNNECMVLYLKFRPWSITDKMMFISVIVLIATAIGGLYGQSWGVIH